MAISFQPQERKVFRFAPLVDQTTAHGLLTLRVRLPDPRLCYFGFKADLKARKEAHHFARNYSCLQMCERCDACQYKSNSTSEYSYKIMGPTARYADHLLSHEEYLATTSKISPWTRVAGFQIENATLDWMHLCYLGTAPSHIASCLKLLKHVG